MRKIVKFLLWSIGCGIALGSVAVFALILLGFYCMSPEMESHTVPTETAYHSAKDLYNTTGMEFPEVIPVDSSRRQGVGSQTTWVKFVPKEKLSSAFYKRLDKECRKDSTKWTKDSLRYLYSDVWSDGGTYVDVPLKGDTITVQYGYGM